MHASLGSKSLPMPCCGLTTTAFGQGGVTNRQMHILILLSCLLCHHTAVPRRSRYCISLTGSACTSSFKHHAHHVCGMSAISTNCLIGRPRDSCGCEWAREIILELSNFEKFQGFPTGGFCRLDPTSWHDAYQACN